MSMKHIAYGTLVGVFAFGVTLATAGQRVPPAPPPPPVPPMAPAAAFVFAPVPPVPPAAPPSLIEPIALGPPGIWGDQAADELYRHAQDLIDAGRYERAIEQLDKLIVKMSSSDRVDAALYWKAYSLEKLGQVAAALTTIVDMEKRFADSRWIREAKALEIEIRQASGQTVSPEAQNDEELKLLALRGLMQSDPDRALPAIEMMLSSNSSIKVKERALFVLSQSRSARAREIITGVAKAGTNPDLQLRAIRYLGAIGAAENRQILDDVYRASTDVAVKRAILRSFMTAGDRARLLSLAKTEALPELRGEAVRQLGVMHAGPELGELYRTEQTADVKKKILQAMFVGDQAEKLVELAKSERDPELRRALIHHLGLSRRTDTSAALAAIYASDANTDVRRAVIQALFHQQNAKVLVDLARAEKDPEMKKEIVSRLSIMKSKDATDYLLELLK